MDSRKRFSALETMCRERAQLAKREFEYWVAEADEWARYKEFLRSINRGNSNPTRLVCGTSEHNQQFISRPNRPKHARVCSCGAWLVAPDAFIRSALVAQRWEPL